MEPITLLTYVLTTFFGYCIGTDYWNYKTFSSDFREIKTKLNDLDEIKARLKILESAINTQHKT